MSTMTRVANWDYQLVMWQKQVLGQPFKIGVTDCAMLAYRALYLLYGRKPCSCFPRYSTEKERLRAHKKTGGIAVKILDVAESKTDRRHARSGDLVTGFGESRYGSVGVVVNDQVISSDPDRGVYRVPLDRVQGTFWRVA